MTPTITLTQLRNLRACADQQKLFSQLFGESVEITEALCVEHATSFNWSWAAKRLLDIPALAEYGRVRDEASDEYERVRDAALDEYDRVCAPALAKYERVCAPAFASLFIAQETAK
jgi:hypothetical protein